MDSSEKKKKFEGHPYDMIWFLPKSVNIAEIVFCAEISKG